MKNKEPLPIIKLNFQLTQSQVWGGEGIVALIQQYIFSKICRETIILAVWRREKNLKVSNSALIQEGPIYKGCLGVRPALFPLNSSQLLDESLICLTQTEINGSLLHW